MLVIDLVLFGPIGATIWAVQMLWIPFIAAGIINGIGHYWGYRNFAADDARTQHRALGHPDRRRGAAQQPPRLRHVGEAVAQWYEFDIGWMYIRILQTLGLAKVRKVAPKLSSNRAKPGATRTRCRR